MGNINIFIKNEIKPSNYCFIDGYHPSCQNGKNP